MGAFMFAAMSLVAVTLLLLLRPWQQPRGDARDATGPQVNAGVIATSWPSSTATSPPA